VFTLLATAVAACVGIAYRLRADTWDMPFWLTAPAVLAPIAAAELFDFLKHRRAARTARAGRTRRAHARKAAP
jgi:hypothetical protein